MGSLLPSLRELLGDEYSLPTTVRSDVRFFLRELQVAGVAFREMASMEGNLDDDVILWVKEETALFYEILAILDNFQAHLRSMNPGPSGLLEGFIAKMKFKWANDRAVRQFARKFSNATHLQLEVSDRRERYRIDPPYVTMLPHRQDELGLENGVEIDLATAEKLTEIEDMYRMPSRVKDEIRFLKRDLQSMHVALRWIASVPALDEVTKAWADDMKEVYCDITNIVDNFQAGSIVADPPIGLKGFIGMTNLKFKIRTAMALRRFQAEIRDMKSCLLEMSQRRERYLLECDVPRHTSKETIDHRSPDLQQDPTSLVGLEGPTDMLVKLLIEETSTSTYSHGLKLASIVGVAGVGKTTLAKAVYHSLAQRFDCTAWVSMSSRSALRSILGELLHQISQDCHHEINQDCHVMHLDERQLVNRIEQTLQNKRCFFVFDDIRDLSTWEKEWKVIQIALIGKNSNWCAVLQTSRNNDVGQVAGGTVYKLEPLSGIFSRQLLYRRLFGSEHKCPRELEDLSGNLLEKCSFIPLAIITTSNLLAGQKLTTEAWQAVHDSNYLAVSDGTKKILGPTYADLSPYLQSCLLYLSMFKKGSVISVDRLIWGWITEGFVIHDQESPLTLREIGETYLGELINRNLIVRVGIDAVRVLNFVHELIISLSAEENFAVILDGRKEKSLPEIVYRLSIQGNTDLPGGRLRRARSLVAYGDAKLMPPLLEFKDLRVLDLAGCRDTLQNSHLAGIRDSFFLRYLVIGGKYITDIPKEIGGLSFLQLLDLKESSVKELTESVFLLRHLKCLCVNSRTKISTGIGKMESLEELGEINISKQELLEELCNLTKLRVLRMSIWSWDESFSEALFGYLRSLVVNEQNMQSLAIRTTCSLHSLDKLNAVTEQAPFRLKKLEISQSTFNTVPTWISSLQYLTSLSIEVYKLSQKEIDMLGNLKILALSLTLKHAPEGWFGSDGFRKLASFHFLCNAMGKIFGPGSMPKLERLKLSFQASRTKDEFEAFDFGLENLSTLQHTHVEINCFSATIHVVEDAVAAIQKTINTEYLEIQRVREKDMLENEVLQCTEDIKSPDGDNNLAACADPDIPMAIPPEVCAQPNFDRTDQVSRISQVMVENMHLRLQLLNHDLKFKKMLSDIHVKDSEIVQAARGRVEDLMEQVLNISCGLSDELGIVEVQPSELYNKTKSSGQHERHIPADEQNSTIVKNAQESDGGKSSSVLENQNKFVSYDIPNPTQMEPGETTNVSQETMCNGKDKQTIAQIISCKPSEVLVHIEDVSIPKKIIEILDKEFAHDGPEKYLDDKLVNATIYCLRHKYLEEIRDGGKVFLENTETCQLLQRDGKHAMPKDSLEKSENLKRAINYLNHDMIFLPLNWEQHWYLAVVSAKQHEIQLLDSMPSKNTEREELKLTLKGIEIYLELAAEEQTIKMNSWSDLKVASWKVRMVEGLPKQKDRSSCGLFMLKYMEYWTGDRLSVNFTQEDITQFRRDLVPMLVNSPLNKMNNNKKTEGQES